MFLLLPMMLMMMMRDTVDQIYVITTDYLVIDYVEIVFG